MPSGVAFTPIKDGSAYNASLSGSIIAINDISIRTHAQLSSELSKYNPGDAISVSTAETYYVSGFFPQGVINRDNVTAKTVVLGSGENGKAFLGVGVLGESVELNMSLQAYAIISVLLFWIFLFSFGIGLVNLLPIKPLDGGLIFEELVSGSRHKKVIVRTVSVFMLLVLIFNIIGPLFLTG